MFQRTLQPCTAMGVKDISHNCLQSLGAAPSQTVSKKLPFLNKLMANKGEQLPEQSQLPAGKHKVVGET